MFCAIALCLLATRASADDNDSPDRVTVLLNDGGRISMQCRIIEYTGKSLRVKLKAGGTLRDYSTQQVVDIQTPQTAPHQKGLEQFAKGEIKEAKTSFEEALTIEPRDWARREILAALIRCALRQGDYTAASTRFLALVTSDPDTRYYRLAPLAWTSTEATPERRSLARQWREQKSEAHRLLAASILLFEQADAAQAETDLKTLSRSANRMVGALAHAQLWRKRVAKGDLLDDELERWQERIDEMPEEVRGGPQYVLGTGYRRLRNHNAAAAAFLWLPLIYPDDTHLAARACVEAGAELVRCGQKPEAARTYREALQRFSETPFAREASQALDELEGK